MDNVPNQPATSEPIPTKLVLKRDEHLTVTWSDGTTDRWTIGQLRTQCPCALCREHRGNEQKKPANRLAILPGNFGGALTVERAERVGNYALRLHFSDGHASGIFSWSYLRGLRDLGQT
ncbi:MAG: DUF971 domain-containing protein [Planctomycetota bacterium]